MQEHVPVLAQSEIEEDEENYRPTDQLGGGDEDRPAGGGADRPTNGDHDDGYYDELSGQHHQVGQVRHFDW